MKDLLYIATHRTLASAIADMTTGRNMDYTSEHVESLEERCFAINDDETVRKEVGHSRIPSQQCDSSISSIDVSKSQMELARTIADSRRHHYLQNVPAIAEVPHNRRKHVSKVHVKQEMEQPADHGISNSSSNEGNHMDDEPCDASTSDVRDELRAAKEMIKSLQKRVVRLEDQRSTLAEANQQWARYVAELKSEKKSACRSASVEDVRGSTAPKRILSEMDTNSEKYATRKSEGDLDVYRQQTTSSGDTREVKTLKNQVSLLTQQVKIYRDDFALERRDRVRSVMETKKLRQEVDRLKAALSKQRPHGIKEQFLTCEDFDYLNN